MIKYLIPILFLSLTSCATSPTCEEMEDASEKATCIEKREIHREQHRERMMDRPGRHL